MGVDCLVADAQALGCAGVGVPAGNRLKDGKFAISD